ncbi:MAG: ABC transporter ATP-binding protein [Haliscomenobacteraceae bacterium CHB4]|nr:putative multidrug ABC transporter ATP-binding protein YbhF [Saprospiraceae bacterium]MCE7924680.1 ABC transporter ATP-binding protein [Haliscomenobacteraceae bacterium CHB4]
MTDHIIQIRNLHKSFGDFKALDGLNLDVRRGEIFGFLGCNGAGKSTTIRCMLSLIKPDAGEILFNGKSTREHRNTFLRQVGCIIEKPDFYTNLSALDNLRISARMYGMRSKKEEILSVIELVGLAGREREAVKTYSQGMKQRLGIAQALLHRPELIILDEPTNGLDPKGIIDLRRIIQRLKTDFQKTVIVSSHILSEIELIADSFCIIDRGKTVIQGRTAELLSENEMLVSVETDQPEQMFRLLQNAGREVSAPASDDQTLTIKTGRADIPDIHREIVRSGLPVYGFHARKKLEDLFLNLTQNTDAHAGLN